MDERKLTAAEKRALMKEQFKRELKEHKEKVDQLKNAQKANEINQKLNQAYDRLKGVFEGNDDSEFLDKINSETAMNEAKVDMILDEFRTQKSRPDQDVSSANSSTFDNDTKTLGDTIASEEQVDITKEIKKPYQTKTLGDDEK